MATQSEWQNFYDEYTAKMNEKYGADSPAPSTQQERTDLAKQQLFQGWLENQISEINRTGEVPETVNMDLTSGGSGWYQLDGVSRFGTYTWKGVPSWTSEIPAGTNYSFAIAQDFKLDFRLNPVSSGYYHTTVANRFVPDGGIQGDFGFMSTLPCMPSITSYPSYAVDIYHLSATVQYQPRNFISTNTYYPNDYMESGGWIFAGGFTFTNEGRDGLENPWDYYNDNLLPVLDPNNAVMPEYSPYPVKPDPEPPEIGGDEEHTGDDIEMNDPTGIGGGFGFVTQYALSGGQLAQLGMKLFRGFTDLNDYINNFEFRVDTNTGSVNFADIMNFFVSLKVYPFPLGNIASLSGAGTDMYIGSGAVPITFGTNLHTMDEFVGVLECGTLSLPFWYGDFRDYDLSVVLYLPYCGTAVLNPCDVLGGTLTCKYYVDFCTGACMAYCLCDTWDGKKMIVASLPGQLGADVPLTATNAGNIMARMYGDRINFAENILTGVKSAGSGIGSFAMGNYAGAVRSALDVFFGMEMSEQKTLSEIGQRGSISAPMLSGGRGMASFGSPTSCYVQVRSRKYPTPENYPDSVGNPASSTVAIEDCTGFCQFINVDVSGIVTDAADQSAIRQALAAGVYV